jgi:hypothetical protein
MTKTKVKSELFHSEFDLNWSNLESKIHAVEQDKRNSGRTNHLLFIV